jgi:NhaP-type Na+/H+ and K+/H+ antiporter
MNSRITNITKEIKFSDLVKMVSELFSTEMHVNKELLISEFHTITIIEPALIIPEVSILYAKDENIDHPSLHIILSEKGINKPVNKRNIISEDYIKVFFFLVNPAKEARQQLRMLSRLVDIVERENFVNEIINLKNHRQIKEFLLHNERYITVQLKPNTKQFDMVGKQLKDVMFSRNILVALIERDGKIFSPHGDTVFNENDVLTIIGEPESINKLYELYLQ